MHTTRKIVIGLSALVPLTTLVGTTAAAAGRKPIGGCPTGFTLVALADLNLGDLGGEPSIDGNNDGYTCVKPTPVPPQPQSATLIDNHVQHTH